MSSLISPPDGGPEAGRRVGALLRLAWQRVRERIYAGVRADGYDDLNPAHVALFRYESLDGRRPTQLAEQMQITKQSINDLLGHLESRGYVERRPDPTDSRARLVRLTARGRQLDAAVRAQARAAEHELAHTLGERRFQEFRETLLRIAGLAGSLKETWPRRPGTRQRGRANAEGPGVSNTPSETSPPRTVVPARRRSEWNR